MYYKQPALGWAWVVAVGRQLTGVDFGKLSPLQPIGDIGMRRVFLHRQPENDRVAEAEAEAEVEAGDDDNNNITNTNSVNQ